MQCKTRWNCQSYSGHICSDDISYGACLDSSLILLVPPVREGAVPEARPSNTLRFDVILYGVCLDYSLILLVPPFHVGAVPVAEPSSRLRSDDISYGVCPDCGLILLVSPVRVWGSSRGRAV